MLEEVFARDTDANNEVVAAYNEVLRKLKVTKRTTKQEEDQEEERSQIIEIATRESPADFAKYLADLKVSMNETLEDLESKLLAEKDKLRTLQQAIEISTNKLAELNDIQANVHTLEALIIANREKSDTFEREMKDRKQAFEYEMIQARKDWQQQEQEYMNKRDLLREKDRAQYEATKRDLEKELAAKRIEFEKELAAKRLELEEEFRRRDAWLLQREQECHQIKEREAKVFAREQEYQQLKESVAQFPEELRRAVQKAEKTITEHLTIKFDYEAKLAAREVETERKLYQQTIAGLESRIRHLESLKYSLNQLSFNTMETKINTD